MFPCIFKLCFSYLEKENVLLCKTKVNDFRNVHVERGIWSARSSGAAVHFNEGFDRFLNHSKHPLLSPMWYSDLSNKELDSKKLQMISLRL